jgi:hypothetical protein
MNNQNYIINNNNNNNNNNAHIINQNLFIVSNSITIFEEITDIMSISHSYNSLDNNNNFKLSLENCAFVKSLFLKIIFFILINDIFFLFYDQ